MAGCQAKLSLLVLLISGSYLQFPGEAQAMEEPSSEAGCAHLQKRGFPQGTFIRSDPEDGSINYLKGKDLSLGMGGDKAFAQLVGAKRYGEAAIRFLHCYRGRFRLADPEKELKVASTNTDELGYKQARLNQSASGLKVWGSELVVHFDRNDHIYLVNGRYMPTPATLPKRPALSEQEAMRKVSAKLGSGGSPKASLVVYYDRKRARLAYEVFTAPSVAEAWELLVDAETGEVLRKVPKIYPK